MAWVSLAGTFLTALGYGIGGGAWGWVVLAAFVVTLVTGLSMKYWLHRMTSALLLKSWFLVAVSISAGEHLSASNSHWAGQALAWGRAADQPIGARRAWPEIALGVERRKNHDATHVGGQDPLLVMMPMVYRGETLASRSRWSATPSARVDNRAPDEVGAPAR